MNNWMSVLAQARNVFESERESVGMNLPSEFRGLISEILNPDRSHNEWTTDAPEPTTKEPETQRDPYLDRIGYYD